MGTEQGTFNDFVEEFPEPVLEKKSGVNYQGARTKSQYRVTDPIFDLDERIIAEYEDAYEFIEFYGEEDDEPPVEQETGNKNFYLKEGTANLGDEVFIELEQRRLTNGDYRLYCAIEAPSKQRTYDILDAVIKPVAREYKAEKTKDTNEVSDITETPDLGWEDIILPEDVEETVEYDVLKPFFYPELREAVGLDEAKGVMLEGEPGVGKTLLAKVIASEYDANFYNVSASDMLSKWYGESNKNVRKFFDQVREEEGPSIVFLDEADALLRNRDGSHEATERVVNEFLGQMDGFEDMDDTLFLGATNRYDALDPAAVRPGRFTECITIPEPEYEERKEILEVHTRKGNFAEDIDYEDLADRTEGYVGADLKGLADKARKSALRGVQVDDLSDEEVEVLAQGVQITADHFEEAFEKLEDEESSEGPEGMFA